MVLINSVKSSGWSRQASKCIAYIVNEFMHALKIKRQLW